MAAVFQNCASNLLYMPFRKIIFEALTINVAHHYLHMQHTNQTSEVMITKVCLPELNHASSSLQQNNHSSFVGYTSDQYYSMALKL